MNSSTMLSTKENLSKFDILPNEVLLEIFEYLPPAYIFETFYFLNRRYSNLLVSMRLRVDLLNLSKQIFDYYVYFLFPLASHCVVSLRCEDTFDRLIYRIHLSKFTSLEYLTLTNIKCSTLPHIIPHLSKFPNLIYLNLKLSTEPIHNELYFEESMLSMEKCILNFNNRLIIQGDQCYSNLKYLTINQYHIDDLLSFLQIYTPKLKHLTITFNDSCNSFELLPKIESKHHLESLTIKQCRIPFDRIEKQILISLPYLQKLNINAIGIDYADGNQWERLLSTSFPCLKTFFLHTIFPEEDASTSNIRIQLLKTFETKYFFLKNWHFALVYNSSTSNIDLFSLPLIDSKFHVNLYNTYIIKTIDDVNIFACVKELTLFLTSSEENLQLPKSCFSNVKHLKLISRFRSNDRLPRTLFVDISNLVKFSNLESIEFIGIAFPSTSFVIFDYTPNLRSLNISFTKLIQMTKDLTDQHVCQQLTKLIKHLNITTIDGLNNLGMFERLPVVFSKLDSLSLHILHFKDLYTLIILMLKKLVPILKTLNLFIEEFIGNGDKLKEFMVWLINYLHSNELEKIDIKQLDNQIYFCF